jgi:cell division protein FtsB
LRRNRKSGEDECASGTQRAKAEAAAALRELEAERARHAATAQAAEKAAKAEEAAKAEAEQLRAAAQDAKAEIERLRAAAAEAEAAAKAEAEQLRAAAQDAKAEIKRLRAAAAETEAAAKAEIDRLRAAVENATLKAKNATLKAKNATLKAEVATLKLERLEASYSEPLLDEDGREVGRVPAHRTPCWSGRKRSRTPDMNALRQLHQSDNSLKRVKVEKATATQKLEAAEDDLEEARETLGYVVQSENNKMTEIDSLKAKVAELERALENAQRP